jgi:hypothetical protein
MLLGQARKLTAESIDALKVLARIVLAAALRGAEVVAAPRVRGRRPCPA